MEARKPDDRTSTSGNDSPYLASRLVTLPNLLSLSRLLLLPIILLLLVQRHPIPALVLMAVSWITDALDGWLARRLHLVSDLGRVLDHVVDKVWVGSVLVCLVAIADLPLYLAAAVIGRDILILAGSAVLMRRHGSSVSSDIVGKVTGFTFALLVAFYTLSIPQLLPYRNHVNLTVGVLIVVSFVNYLGVYLRKTTRFRLPGETS
uniref:CDP-alcohol phosphatidyltransferase family protein n=1 Tax=candidate division WOR-3 bacterium TaxID=2052148 RepID=A0A7C4GHF5_UNCW3